jgi:hypothetical protein
MIFTKNALEVMNMLLSGWNIDEGREDKAFEVVKNALKAGLPLEIIGKLTGLDRETIKDLSLG